jgi:hypothetical protein
VNPDGIVATVNPDGIVATVNPDGIVATVSPDGIVATVSPDGSFRSRWLEYPRQQCEKKNIYVPLSKALYPNLPNYYC